MLKRGVIHVYVVITILVIINPRVTVVVLCACVSVLWEQFGAVVKVLGYQS